MTRFCIINASPRTKSRCVRIVENLLNQLENEGEVEQIDVGIAPVNPCTACDQCKHTSKCVIEDEMERYRAQLEDADTLIIVSPVYFSGTPAQLKAFIDRLQPYFWTYSRGSKKRNAYLFVVREGGDPHGFDPLVTIVRSGLAVAGFTVEDTFDCLNLFDVELDELVMKNMPAIKGH